MFERRKHPGYLGVACEWPRFRCHFPYLSLEIDSANFKYFFFNIYSTTNIPKLKAIS